jgi:peptidoglycan/LPS O-acetylase OafA/YrhL
LYLTHFFVLVAMLHADKHIGHPLARWANDGLSGFVGTYLATLCFAIPLSILSWRYIEQPGINLGRFIIARRAESRSSLCTTVAQASKC